MMHALVHLYECNLGWIHDSLFFPHHHKVCTTLVQPCAWHMIVALRVVTTSGATMRVVIGTDVGTGETETSGDDGPETRGGDDRGERRTRHEVASWRAEYQCAHARMPSMIAYSDVISCTCTRVSPYRPNICPFTHTAPFPIVCMSTAHTAASLLACAVGNANSSLYHDHGDGNT